MSIWTELMFLHGHVATPLALALVAGTCACPTAADASTRRDTGLPGAPDAATSGVPAMSRAPATSSGVPVTGHALRTTGQLR
jgi:hypothetical protein